MKKNIKRYLSYVLGVILAMGLGLSYAYAVGANDSNAFVTTTEWETKVAQIEASLDNVTKTINDTNMDFVMSGPRLQTSLMEGFENISGYTNANNDPLDKYNEYSTWDNYNNYWSTYGNVSLADLYNGMQCFTRNGYYGSNLSNNEFVCKARFAIKSNEDPNVYLVFSYYWVNNTGVYIAEVNYYNITDSTTAYFAPARTFSVTYPLDEWWSYEMLGTNYTPKNITRTSSGLFSGSAESDYHFRARRVYGGNSCTYGNLTNPATAYAQCDISGNNAVCTYWFPATCNIIMHNGSGSNTTGMIFNFFPLRLNGRKYGNYNDALWEYSNRALGIQKVYSPQKGCMALKSQLNGEVPIFKD